MTASSVTGIGLGAAQSSKGPGNNRDFFVSKASAHVVAAGSTAMGDNTWKVDVIFPEPLEHGVDHYAVIITVEQPSGLDNLNQDGDNYYDYDLGFDYYPRILKLDESYSFDPDKGSSGAWYVTEDSIENPGRMTGFTVHIGTSDNSNPRPKVQWAVMHVGIDRVSRQ